MNGVGEIPEITLTDLAQFAPAPATLSAEPSNAGIADMPTNFLGAASVHTQTGSIFGFPVTVRFTPVAYDYTYGDGISATVTTAGRSWEELGQAQFTPTPTSHVYADRGTYTAGLSIRYSAEVDLGRGWYPIAGKLTIPTAPQQIQIFEAHTALVAHTCTERPTAPGC
ncbi:PKD domain-containing protein [Microbacterium hydrocarbonoxydans]|uniref:PKD domain-containing protein n=1 Tax=Microbacterium hydrocarbonoxydans TaxID=273678 RepID=UPI003D9951D2